MYDNACCSEKYVNYFNFVQVSELRTIIPQSPPRNSASKLSMAPRVLDCRFGWNRPFPNWHLECLREL